MIQAAAMGLNGSMFDECEALRIPDVVARYPNKPAALPLENVDVREVISVKVDYCATRRLIHLMDCGEQWRGIREPGKGDAAGRNGSYRAFEIWTVNLTGDVCFHVGFSCSIRLGEVPPLITKLHFNVFYVDHLAFQFGDDDRFVRWGLFRSGG